MAKDPNGHAVVKRAFGASLYEQGRGFYVTLELLAIAWGTHALNGEVLPDVAGTLRMHRRSHDFGRRLASALDPGFTSEDRSHLSGKDTEPTLRRLLGSLRVPVPGRRSEGSWQGTHLYPYTGALVHYDAVFRPKSKPKSPNDQYGIERYLYRGAGGFAHKLLRTDQDKGRLAVTRRGLTSLISDTESSLARLALALTEHDAAKVDEDFDDELEAEATDVGGTAWPELLRKGVHNVLGRTNVPRARQVEALMHWVPYCVARYQHARALVILGNSSPDNSSFPVDCRSGASSIRDASRSAVDVARGAIFNALANTIDPSAPGESELLGQRSQKWRDHCRGFFTGTLGSVGALNAMSGKRHLCLRADLLEAIVLATLKPGEEITFESFCEGVLFDELALVVDERSAQRSESLLRINRAEFRENGEELARLLKDLGLLREYSDATRMVTGEAS